MSNPLTNPPACFSCLLVVLASLVLAPIASAEPAADFWIAPGGRDDAPGNREAPFVTLSRARDAVRALIARRRERDVRVVLRGGTYRVAEPIVFGPEDSGTPEHSVTYAAFPGETPVLSGGRAISGWRRVADGSFETTIPDVAAGRWRFRELFVGGERRRRARFPNAGYLRVEKPGPDDRTSFTFAAGDLGDWRAKSGEIELVFLHDWSISRVPIASIDVATRGVTLAAPVGPGARHYAMSWFEKHPRYFLEGAAAFLDAPGEWQLDEASGRLRYRPLEGETPESIEATAPFAGEILVVRGEGDRPVRNVHFDGIAVEHAAWLPGRGGYAAGQAGYHEQRDGDGGTLREPMPAAVHFEIATDCSFENGRVARVGRSGVWLGSRCTDCRVARTVITDVGGNGIMIGEDRSRAVDGKGWWHAAPEQVARGNVVEDSVIEHCGRIWFGSVGVWIGMAEKTRIAHNTIRHLPYTGVSVGWMWSPTPTPCKANVVENNHIHHVMQVLSDGGGIYTLGLQPGSALRGNLIHDVPLNAGRAESNGMFIDEGSTGLTIERNVIYAVERSPLRFHRATTNLVRDNVLVTSKGQPAFRYNNTKEEDIRKVANDIREGDPGDALEAVRGRVGPREPSVSPRADGVSVVKTPPTSSRNPHYAGNREPLVSTALIKLPVGTIEPRGWLRKQLELQAKGFLGHLGEISSFLAKKGNAWLDPTGDGQHGWEEPPYWLKGYLNIALILGDEGMLDESKVWIEAALKSQKPDGWFGPDGGRGGVATRLRGRDDLWPNMIMLFCLQDYHEATGDARVVELMTKYFEYLAGVPEKRFLVGYWPKMRGGDLLYSVYWLYNRTGDRSLLALAEKVHRHTANWTSGVINWHNVNMGQGFGQPATFFMQSRDETHRRAPYRNYDIIRREYGQVPGGMFGGDENCRPGYTGPRQAVETCGMVEMMLSLETLTWITGDLLWADRCEDAAFNSLPAALTADMKALRYLTAPNMVLSDSKNKSPGIQNGGPMFHMNPHGHRCCQHNQGHGWPYFAEHLWYATADRGAAAVFYSDSKATLKVGEDGARVTIDEKTRYPFDEQVELVVSTGKPVAFPLYLRIPGWCDGAAIEINGERVSVETKPLHFVRVSREWSSGDRVRLTLPMEVRLRRWKANHDSVSVDRGPLTYSLDIGEKYVRHGGTDRWPAWEIRPTTPWNYGLDASVQGAADFEIVKRDWPESDMPFTHEGAPIALRTRARRIPAWEMDHLGLVGKLQPSPAKTSAPVETVTLIPMGAARLRITAFPTASDAAGAHEWKAPPKPAYRAVASHCWQGDTERAVADGIVPKSSGDHSIPRFTWWDRRGTTEWIQAEFGEPRTLSKVEVYWFDDTGQGACRVPVSWRLLYRESTDAPWKQVANASGFGVEKDRFNVTTFKPVKSDALRIEAKLGTGVSGGILEWRVK